MMKKTFAPPLAKPRDPSLREVPESPAKEVAGRANELMSNSLSRGTSDLTATKRKTGHPTGPEAAQGVKRRAKRDSSQASAKERCSLTDLHFEEIVQSVLQKSLRECLEESQGTFHQADATEAAEQEELKKDALDASLPAGEGNQRSDDPENAVGGVEQKESGPRAKKRSKLPSDKTGEETAQESPGANTERSKCRRKGAPKKIVQGYTLSAEQEELEDGGGHTFSQCVAWVQCSSPSCKKWRRLSSEIDPSALPEDWTCSQNADLQYQSCDVPEEAWSGSENDVVYAAFVPGSIVWAKLHGYPWWPGMVECDPDIGEYFLFSPRLDSLPSKYHVTFFGDTVSRAWISAALLRSCQQLSADSQALEKVRSKGYRQGLAAAMKMAKEAARISMEERVRRFGFISRYGEGAMAGLLSTAFPCGQEGESAGATVRPTSGGQEKGCRKGLKKKFTAPGSPRQPRPPVGGRRVNRAPARGDAVNPVPPGTRQAKDETALSRPGSREGVLEDLQAGEEREEAKEAPDGPEPFEDCSPVLFEE
ncbi:zinc finger CW-type PWWP domain protein 1 isoform X2 [Carettochelys insculpta]|uniref:zinc finger CW-type PWWP domain protein 1 isoform X2 n=1 Tax=Carettochelys insculpta TaxID=44489 RepID=UPI003EBF3711